MEAIETNLISKLGDVLSPIKVAYLAPDVVSSVAGESDESRAKRRQLMNQLDVLVQGLQTCKTFVVGTWQGTFLIYLPMQCYELAVEANVWLSIGTRDVAVLSERSGTSSPDLLSLSLRTESAELVANDEPEVSEVPNDELYDESVFPEAPEPVSEPVSELEPELEPPLDEVNYAVEVVAEPIHDDWGGSTPFRSTKKTKKGKRAV